MYSQVGIIVGAVVSAFFGLYVFVPDRSLRTSDYWLGVWQPMLLLNVSAVVTHSPSSEQKKESSFPLHASNEEEEEGGGEKVMDENQFQFIGHEDLMKRLQAMSDLHGPEIGPRIPPPKVPLSRILRFYQAIVEILSFLWPHFIICLLLYLLGLVLAQKTCVLRVLQKLYQAGEVKNVELLAGQKSKESLDKGETFDKDKERRRTASEKFEHHETKETLDNAKTNDDRVRDIMVESSSGFPYSKVPPQARHRKEDKKKRPTASGQSGQPRTETLNDAKANDARVREIMVEEDQVELPECKGLPKAKHRRPGRRNSKRDHKFEAEKRKRKREEEKAAALAGVVEEDKSPVV